ncbi:MAG TPA: YncE family protein [Rhodopila sp.]|uniref:lactonase family protein n=1 Tax=Rhodopila sp. TaxID=2480087 RepID=UPI002C6202B5|nr:YncE family protein [Rhodopila sp.]HVY15118.1 YncE family protein [Rhodopila sp.]
MTMRVALGLTACLILAAPALASPSDILIGLDEKVTYDANGSVNGPPGKDAVLVVSVANPTKPHIRGSLPLMNSLLGPPTNLQITPDGKLGLVANSIVMNQDGSAWKTAPDDKLFVIDLTANPPVLKDTITVGRQPSGLAIAHDGKLALIANRAGKSVSVLSIDNGVVKAVGEVPMEQEASAVVITPDGKRAFVCLNTVNKIGVLSIDGTKVTYDKSLDIPSAFNPYNIDITPDGKYVVASNTGAMKNNHDAEVVIEAAGPHPHVVDVMSPGVGPEGFAIAPNGKWAATPLIEGSGAKPTDWFKTATGELAVMSIGAGGKLTVTGKAKLGALPEGIAFSPNSEYIYVGNYIGKDLQVFRVNNGKPVQVGPTIPLPGQPASMRGPAR